MADAAVNLDIDGTITVADNFLNGNFALMTKNTADAIVNLDIVGTITIADNFLNENFALMTKSS
jgi:uncharacterized HAD superfamily protein